MSTRTASSKSLLLALIILLASTDAIPTTNIITREVKTPHGIQRRSYRQGECTSDDFGRFAVEESFGIGYADAVSNLVSPSNEAYKTFFGTGYQTQSAVNIYRSKYLEPFAGLSQTSDIEVTINCRNVQNLDCTQPPENGIQGQLTYALTNSDTKTITLCDPFFALPESSSSNAAAWCPETDRTLDEFETGAFTLLHEFGHLDYTLNKLDDYTWGSLSCASLAVDDEDEAYDNADNWMFAAMGMYWNNECGRVIPFIHLDFEPNKM